VNQNVERGKHVARVRTGDWPSIVLVVLSGWLAQVPCALDF
jgi:hypothetical protein